MDEVIRKTYEFIDYLDNSQLIYDLVKYRDLCLMDNDLLELIKIANECSNESKYITYKKKILNNSNYLNYIRAYNELKLIVNKINSKYNLYLENRSCSYESH